jgi:hypothetical protein
VQSEDGMSSRLAWLFSSAEDTTYAAVVEDRQSSAPWQRRGHHVRLSRMDLVKLAQDAIVQACATRVPPRPLIQRLGGEEKVCVLLTLLSVNPDFDNSLNRDEEAAFTAMADRLISATSSFHLNAGVVAALVLSVLFPLAYEEDDTIADLDATDSWLTPSAIAESEPAVCFVPHSRFVPHSQRPPRSVRSHLLYH